MVRFIDLQEEQAKASSQGQVVHCEWPCNHGLPYTHVDWVSRTILRFLRDQGVLQR